MFITRYFFCFLAISLYLVAAPSGQKVVNGKVDFFQKEENFYMLQHSRQAIVHWEDFSIDHQQRVVIHQPLKDSSVLHRVVGESPSKIYGSIYSNGKVFLINQNGILIGPNGSIETVGFIASTLNVQDRDFLKGGDLVFSGNSEEKLVHLGKIQAKVGDVFFFARKVENEGSISTHATVGIATSSEILLKEKGEERIFIKPKSEGFLKNNGDIQAIQIELRSVGGNPFSLALKQTGLIQANGSKVVDGKIILCAERGMAEVSGNLHAQDINKGARVHLLADYLKLDEQLYIDVSHEKGGGEVLIGKNDAGQVKDANWIFVGREVLINACALKKGNGGKVVLSAKKGTCFEGNIQVNGGEVLGNGGFVEISSPKYFKFNGKIDSKASEGKNGTLVLDSSDVMRNNFETSGFSHN